MSSKIDKNVQIYNNLLEIIRLKGKKYSKFFADNGISRAKYNNWKTGVNGIGTDSMYILTTALDVTEEEIKTGRLKEKPTFVSEPQSEYGIKVDELKDKLIACMEENKRLQKEIDFLKNFAPGDPSERKLKTKA